MHNVPCTTALYEAAKKEGRLTVYSPQEAVLQGLEKEFPRTFAGIEVKSATVEPTAVAIKAAASILMSTIEMEAAVMVELMELAPTAAPEQTAELVPALTAELEMELDLPVEQMVLALPEEHLHFQQFLQMRQYVLQIQTVISFCDFQNQILRLFLSIGELGKKKPFQIQTSTVSQTLSM